MILIPKRFRPHQRTSAPLAARQRASKRWICVCWLAFALLLNACGSTNNENVLNITGSTSVAPFIEHLAEIYQQEHEGVTLNVQSLGSTAGVRAAIDGVAEIAMSSRNLDAAEAELLEQVVVARDALAVIVHPSNPLVNLEQAQVQAIFSGEVTSWAAFGGADKPIVLVVREAGSGTFGAFEELVMQGVPITPAALRQGSNGAIRQIVAEDPNAIGYISLGIVDSTVKAVAINGVEPSVAEVEAGNYTFVRPFLFVWQKDRPMSALATQFLEYTLGPAGQAELTRLGLVKGVTTR